MFRSRRGLNLDWVEATSGSEAVWNAVLGWLAVFVVALAAMVGYFEYRRLKLEDGIAEFRAEIEARQKRAADQSSRRRSDPEYEKAVRNHNEIVTVLTAIERVALDGVQIDELTMRPETPEFRIDAKAPTAAAAQRYVASLNENDPDGDWSIVQIKSLVREPGFGFSAASLKRRSHSAKSEPKS